MPISAIQRHAGGVLMVGYEGPPDAVLADLRHQRAGGVILFSRNIENAQQVRDLTGQLRRAAGGCLPTGVDQEGGRVARLAKAGLPAGPSARWVAQHGPPQAAYQWGINTGNTLKSMGFSINFAPILDVDTHPANPIIGDRSYGRDAATVAAYGLAALQGLAAAGIIGCGKHFPGHGDTDLDSHLALPTVRHELARLAAVELMPFRKLAQHFKAIMTAHVVFPDLDNATPATLSKKILTGLLRSQIGYSGVIVSDDLEMAAVAAHHPTEELAVRTVAAGADLLLVCKTESRRIAAYEGLVREGERSPAFAKQLEKAALRVKTLLWGPHGHA